MFRDGLVRANAQSLGMDISICGVIFGYDVTGISGSITLVLFATVQLKRSLQAITRHGAQVFYAALHQGGLPHEWAYRET